MPKTSSKPLKYQEKLIDMMQWAIPGSLISIIALKKEGRTLIENDEHPGGGVQQQECKSSW